MSNDVELGSPSNVAPDDSYEHAARAGDFIFLAGQIAMDETGAWVGGDAANQARQIYINIDRILKHMGATRRQVVKVNTILTDLADRPDVAKIRLEYFGDHHPPHTGVVVAALGLPEIRMEVEVIAYAPKSCRKKADTE